MRYAVERIYHTVVEANSEEEAVEIARDLPPSEFETRWIQTAELDPQ